MKPKDYQVKGKLQPDGREFTTTVTAHTAQEAKEAIQRKHDYKAYGITVKSMGKSWF
jgi:hypothetical protein